MAQTLGPKTVECRTRSEAAVVFPRAANAATPHCFTAARGVHAVLTPPSVSRRARLSAGALQGLCRGYAGFMQGLCRVYAGALVRMACQHDCRSRSRSRSTAVGDAGARGVVISLAQIVELVKQHRHACARSRCCWCIGARTHARTHARTSAVKRMDGQAGIRERTRARERERDTDRHGSARGSLQAPLQPPGSP